MDVFYTIDKREKLSRCRYMRDDRFASVVETKCDYHQNPVQNASVSAEQTYAGKFSLTIIIENKDSMFSSRFTAGMIRTMLSFSVIHTILVIITFICGLYSIRDYRYTYKRLTGMIYILAGKNSFNSSSFVHNLLVSSLFVFSCFSCCLYRSIKYDISSFEWKLPWDLSAGNRL